MNVQTTEIEAAFNEVEYRALWERRRFWDAAVRLGWSPLNPWHTSMGRRRTEWGFGARDGRGNRWDVTGKVEAGQVVGVPEFNLVQRAGPQTEAEKLRARHDEIMLGMDITTSELRAEAAECLRRAREIEAN